MTEPVVVACYVADVNGNPVPIDYATLVQQANGSDPFTVPNGADPNINQDLKNLFAARFMTGFKAQIGLPPGIPPTSIPDVVTLTGDTSSVTYNLMCSEFTVVEYKAGGFAPPSWMNLSQQPGSPWLFTSKVDLRLLTTDQSDYSKLPPAVQAQIKNLGGNAFSVQQLLFDLDNAALETTPTISGVDPSSNLYACLQKYFLDTYYTALQQNGQPVLGCNVSQSTVPPATLTLTDLNFETSPYLGTNGQPVVNPTPDQQGLYTLNYLCAANGNTLPAPSQFGWNWMEPADEANFDGVIAINRNTFANFFASQLPDYVSSNCYLSNVRVYMDGLDVDYSWSLTPYQTPTVSQPASGAVVLSYSYSSTASDKAGLNGDMGQMTLSPSFTLTVSFTGNTIVIVQHLVIYLRVQVMQTSADGNVVDKTITDTYTLAVDDNGNLTASLSSVPVDNSQTPSTNGFLNFFTGLNAIISDIATWTRNFTQTNFTDIPVSDLQSFVFPGGKTFAFKDAAFSDNQDLTTHITYVDPS